MANMTFKASLLPSADNTYSLGSNDTNNLKRWKINGFSGGPIEYIVGGQAAATGSWTGTTQDSELVTGKAIAYKLPFAGSGNASLTLTFTNPTGASNSGAIPVYLNNTRVTTHYAAGSVIIMVYDGTNWRSTDYWNSNSRDAGYGKINLTQSDAATAITTNTTQLAAHTYNEAMTLTAGNKWVQFQGTNSGSNNADILTVGHSLSGVTAGDYGDDSDQTPSYGGTFNVPTLSVDAAGHITAISTHSVKIPTSDDTDVKQRIYGSATNVELPIPGINGSASTTATVPSIGTSYKDTYAAIPTANIATINPSTGKITIPGGLKVGVGNSTRMPVTGIEIHDTRTEEFTPGAITQGINFFFTNKTNPVGNSWCSGIYVHGWTGPYAAWCLTGPAGEADVSTKPLYVRTSKSATEWGAYRKIYDTSNKPTPSEILGESDTTKFYRGDQSWSNEISGGLFKVTNNNNTLFIGSQNTNFMHFQNSANIPFYFNKTIDLDGDLIPYGTSNTKNLGSSSKRWQKLYIGTADTYGSNTQPIYWNAGVPTAITYTANRLYYPSTTTAFTAGTHYVSDTKIAINSASIPSQTLYVEGQTKINNTTASSTANESGTLIISNSNSGNVALELWRNANASWQLANEGGILYLRNNYTTAKQSSYTQSSLIIDYNTGNTAISGSLSVGQTTRNTSYKLYVNGTANITTSALIKNITISENKISSTSTLYLNRAANSSIIFQYDGTNKIWIDQPNNNFRPDVTNSLSLGTSAYRWKNLFIGTADSYGSTSQPIYWNAGVPATCNIISSGNYKNGFATIFDGNGYGEIACGLDWHKPTSTNDFDLRLHIEETHNGLGVVAGSGFNSAFTATNFYGNLHGNADTATNADKVDNYHASDLWRKDGGTWNPGANISLGATANSQEWSFDITRNGYTGCYWHVWDSSLGSMLKVTADDGKVYAPKGFVGDLTGNANTATSATTATYATYLKNQNVSGLEIGTSNWTYNPKSITNLTRVWGQYGKISSQSSDSADMSLYLGVGSSAGGGSGGAGWYWGMDGGLMAMDFVYGGKIWGAVWNDYAEMRNVPEAQNELPKLKPGMCVQEVGDDTMIMTTERLQRGCKIISDTFGFNIGETEDCKTPIAVSGRALVYLYESREEAKTHIGWPVCSGPNGTVSIMTEEEEEKYPSRIVGTISAVPDYEEWGTGKVKVNGRIWIYVK